MSVQPPIKDTAINMFALLLGAGGVILIIIVVAILIAIFTHH